MLPLVLLLDGVLLLAIGLDARLRRATVAVQLTRQLAGKLAVGVANRVTVVLRNRSDAPVTLLVRDSIPEGMVAEPAELTLRAGPHGEARAVYSLRPPRRGRFAFGALHYRVRTPLGLAWVEGQAEAAGEARVYPDLRAASRLLLASASRELLQLGVRRVRRDGQGSEFARLREYVPGDPYRDIDWKATARRRAPVTRVYETEKSQQLVLCVDAGRAMAAQAGGLSKLDHAIHAALFLAFVAIRQGDRVGLAVFSDELQTFVAPGRGRAQYRKLVDALYAVEPSKTFTDYQALFRALGAKVRRRALVGLFTDLADDEQARGLVSGLRVVSRRHLTLAVCLKDRGLERLLTTRAPGPDEAFQQAVAVELVEERERILLQLAEAGVHVVDATPDELTVELVNRYLDLKRRALL